MIIIPEEGLDHPALAVLEEDQLLSVMVSHELMQAIRDATAAAALHSLVHWDRDGGLYVLNLWDVE